MNTSLATAEPTPITKPTVYAVELHSGTVTLEALHIAGRWPFMLWMGDEPFFVAQHTSSARAGAYQGRRTAESLTVK